MTQYEVDAIAQEAQRSGGLLLKQFQEVYGADAFKIAVQAVACSYIAAVVSTLWDREEPTRAREFLRTTLAEVERELAQFGVRAELVLHGLDSEE